MTVTHDHDQKRFTEFFAKPEAGEEGESAAHIDHKPTLRRTTRGNSTNSFQDNVKQDRSYNALLVLSVLTICALGFALSAAATYLVTLPIGKASLISPVSALAAMAILSLIGCLGWLTLNGAAIANLFDNEARVQNLNNQNSRLAERLEQLEDQSWEIRESEEIHRSLLETFGDIVVHRDASGNVLFSNGPFNSYFGKTNKLPQFSDTDVNSKHPVSREIEIDSRKGKRWFSWTDISMRDLRTGEIGIRTVARDITERKTSEEEIRSALQRAEQANASKSQFLAMVSHEIRTPLNGVLGMATLLKASDLQPDQRNYVEAISTSGQILLGLIEDLLDTAKIENNQIVLQNAPSNLVKLIESVGDVLAPKAHEKNLHLAIHTDPRIADELMLDPARLRQVLLNLAGNSVKFTQTGGVGIDVTLQEDKAGDGNRQLIQFDVTDSGPGIAPEDQQRIFEEFVQTEEGATRKYGGAGLGLAISRRIVELMGGEVTLSSSLGAGAKFSFSIPVDIVSKRKIESTKAAAKQSVLLVLPVSPARETLRKSLISIGADVNAVESLDGVNGVHRTDTIILAAADWALHEIHELRSNIGEGHRIISIGNQTASTWNGDQRKDLIDGWLTWPVRRTSMERVLGGERNEPTKDLQQPYIATSNQEPLNILLAEDNPINAMLAKSLLAKLGHRVVHCENGKAAFECFPTAEFDLVFLDLHMPIMDGLEALEKIRNSSDHGRDVPIVMLTADGQEQVKQQAIETGANEFLMKPLDLRHVCSLIDTLSTPN